MPKVSYQPWLERFPDYLQLTLRVKPASRVNALFIDNANRLQLTLKAKPQDGKANKMLIVYLAKLLRLTQKQVIITAGLQARDKKVRLLVPGVMQEALVNALYECILIQSP